MPLFFDPARGLATAALIGAMAVAAPLIAVAADPAPAPAASVAQADTAAAPAKSKTKRADRVEAYIKSVHDALKITSEQETQWNAVADAMRDDSKAMQAVIAERRKNRGTMSAIDDLKSYQTVAETHVEGLQKLIPAFQALYDSMSPEQKKNADAIFARRHHRARAAAKPAPQQ